MTKRASFGLVQVALLAGVACGTRTALLSGTAESNAGGTVPGQLTTGGATGTGGAPKGTGGTTGTGGAPGTGGSTAVGQALHFDGIDDTVILPAGMGAASETAFSSELWFKTTTLTGMLFEVNTPGGGADRSSYLKEGRVCFYVWTPDYSELCTKADTYSDGVWHHVAGTLGRNNGQRLYVDGKLEASASKVTTSAFSTDQQFHLGYGNIGAYGPLIYFAGVMDDVRVWNIERSYREVDTNRGAPIDPATSGLQGYWKLDDSGSATSATDSTSAAHHGSLVGFSFAPSPWVTPGAF